MKLEFIGVGEAFDPQYGNASYLLHSETKLLIDCGFAVPRNLFYLGMKPGFIDAIYITHFHADHIFGLPALVLRWHEDGREKPLTIIGQTGIKERASHLLDIGYPGFSKKLKFEINFIEVKDKADFNEFKLDFAPTDHSVRNLAIRVERKGKSIAFSGDGGLTDASKKLFSASNFLVLESYKLADKTKGHSSVSENLDFVAYQENVEALALVHIQRDERPKVLNSLDILREGISFDLIVPAAGDVFMLN